MAVKKDLGVRVLVESGATGLTNRVGRVIFPPAMLREQLVKRKLVEVVTK